MKKKQKYTEIIYLDIGAVAKDIIALKFKKTDTLNDCQKKFFSIMRKYGIKQGTTRYNEEGKPCGRLCNNFEWTMCKQMFIKKVEDFFVIEEMFGGGVPKDLLG